MRFPGLLALAALISVTPPAGAEPIAKGPFDAMPGLWSGQGRLGFKDGKIESVTCRTTYFVNESGNELKQTIRCASGGAKVEVKSVVTHDDGKLAGTWVETVYNKAGEIAGEVTGTGLRVKVKSADVDATMDIIVRGATQIVEIHFHDSTLLGLTLVLTRGTSDTVTSGIKR